MNKQTIIYEFEDYDKDGNYLVQDNKKEINIITHAKDAYSVLYDIMEDLRSEYKNASSDELEKFIERKRSQYFEMMEENRINLEDLQ